MQALGAVKSLAVHPDSKEPLLNQAPILISARIAPGAGQSAQQLQVCLHVRSPSDII